MNLGKVLLALYFSFVRWENKNLSRKVIIGIRETMQINGIHILDALFERVEVAQYLTASMNHLFYFLYSEALTSRTLLTLEGLPLGLPVPRESKCSPTEHNLQMQANKSSLNYSHLLHRGLTITCQITPGPDIRQPGTIPLPQSPLK